MSWHYYLICEQVAGCPWWQRKKLPIAWKWNQVTWYENAVLQPGPLHLAGPYPGNAKCGWEQPLCLPQRRESWVGKLPNSYMLDGCWHALFKMLHLVRIRLNYSFRRICVSEGSFLSTLRPIHLQNYFNSSLTVYLKLNSRWQKDFWYKSIYKVLGGNIGVLFLKSRVRKSFLRWGY